MTSKTKKPDVVGATQKLAEELLSKMSSKAKIEVSEDKENLAALVNISTQEETGLLIGRHGETLNSIQTILSLMLRQETGDWVRVIVNVGDWREKQEGHLKELAASTADRAIQTNEPQPLYNLTPAQRRVIHLALSENPAVETESVGEGEERYLLVRPKGK